MLGYSEWFLAQLPTTIFMIWGVIPVCCMFVLIIVLYIFHHMPYKCMEIHVVVFKEKDRINKMQW